MQSLSAGRSWAIVCLCSSAVAIALSAGVTPAAAVVARIGGHGYGIAPISGADEANLGAAGLAQQAAGLALGPLAHRFD
ncbi:MAG: hypothetical protein QOG40_1572, partial [Solirubrobacteraceae bacterium]|nr:hypothetical protein [Solirubrobacteraceae bacterium]